MGDLVLQHQSNPGALGANLSAFFFSTAGLPSYVGNDGIEHTIVGVSAQNASLVFAGPASGNAALPTFRALAGGDVPKLVVNSQSANYTLALVDANVAYVRVSNANDRVVTVPSQANVPFANGSAIVLARAGAGNVTVAAQANVTVNNSSSSSLRAQGSVAALVMVSPDVWDLFGDLTP